MFWDCCIYISSSVTFSFGNCWNMPRNCYWFMFFVLEIITESSHLPQREILKFKSKCCCFWAPVRWGWESSEFIKQYARAHGPPKRLRTTSLQSSHCWSRWAWKELGGLKLSDGHSLSPEWPGRYCKSELVLRHLTVLKKEEVKANK